jgi:hypothetical protein
MAASAYDSSGLTFSWVILFTLLVILGSSVAVFVWQVRRWTTHRGWRDLLDFSRERGFTLSRPDLPAGEPFDRLNNATIVTALESDKLNAMQLRLAPAGSRWHVLVQSIASSWPTTALRPSTAAASLIDEFALSGYPQMGDVRRFVIFGSDSHAARILSKSEARALLPPDIGLLLQGKYLVLDFSSRPFDGIELGRMIALAEQLASHLPAM